MLIKKEWLLLFEEFYQHYDNSNPKIKERYLHTYRVVDRIEELAISLHLTEEEIELAELIALLHDIGRFEQLSIYHTVNDRKSLDHGEYGVKILFEDGLIENKQLPTTNEEVSSICRDLFFHHQMIPYKELKTDSDHLLIYLGYVYELYFLDSFRYLKETKLYQRMVKELNYPPHLKKYFQEVEKYIQDKSEKIEYQN